MDTIDRKPCYEGPEPWGKSVEHDDHVWTDDGEHHWYCTGLASALINRPFSRERQHLALLKHQRDQLEEQMKRLSETLTAQVKGQLKVTVDRSAVHSFIEPVDSGGRTHLLIEDCWCIPEVSLTEVRHRP